MATTTTYDVLVNYKMRDDASRGTQGLTNHVQQLERSTASAHGWMAKLGAMAAGFFGFQQANKHLIQFNANLEQSQIQIAGLMAQAGRGDYASNVGQAATLVKQMQLDARASVGTTQDFVNMASMLVQPLTMAGASMENLRDMTKQTVVASRAMGIDAAVAARDVDQAVRGVYHSVDQFSGKILTPLGYGGEEGRKKFNQMTKEKRLAEIQRALAAPAIAAMAGAQETSFAGVTSTLLDNIQMTLGKVGMPLFKGITKEVQHWNEWLDKNQAKVDYLANVAGKKLLDFAVTFKDAVVIAAQNWDKIAVAWAGLKAAGYLAGGAGGMMGGAAGAAGVGKFGTSVAAVSLVASAVYIGGQAIADFIDRRQTASMASGGRISGGMAELARGMEAGDMAKASALRQMLLSSGLADNSGLNKQAFVQALGAAGRDTRVEWSNALGISQDKTWANSELIAEKMAKRFGDILTGDYIGKGGMMQDLVAPWRMTGVGDAPMANPEKAKVSVTINRIEVASDDPDRFVFGMVNAFRDAAKNPGGISGSLRLAAREG